MFYQIKGPKVTRRSHFIKVIQPFVKPHFNIWIIIGKSGCVIEQSGKQPGHAPKSRRSGPAGMRCVDSHRHERLHAPVCNDHLAQKAAFLLLLSTRCTQPC
jgi:hypothetical protein